MGGRNRESRDQALRISSQVDTWLYKYNLVSIEISGTVAIHFKDSCRHSALLEIKPLI